MRPGPAAPWELPLLGILKINFDGSFLKDTRKGGYGGGHKG